MLGCARERKREERACDGSQPRSRKNFEHPSLGVRDAGACGGPAAASVLPLGSTDLRLHPTGTGLVNALPCQGQRSSGVSATSELSLTCPPNAHAELRTGLPRRPYRGAAAAATDEASEGAKCGLPCRHAVDLFCARERPARQLERGVRPLMLRRSDQFRAPTGFFVRD